MTQIIELPFPPSVNRLYSRGRGRVFKTGHARLWEGEAEALCTSRHIKPNKIMGRFTAKIILDMRRRRGDADNRIKVVLDFLQRYGFIENDRHCDLVTAEWGRADEGCKVMLRGVE